jgi:hypothetical protein
MSALGQKQTCAPQKRMSALLPIATAKADFRKRPFPLNPPKADMCSALAQVCFGPKADIRFCGGYFRASPAQTLRVDDAKLKDPSRDVSRQIPRLYPDPHRKPV